MLESLSLGDTWRWAKFILHYEMVMSLWGSEVEYYGLNMKFPPQAPYFEGMVPSWWHYF
jgi:hypothetical protein